MNELIENRQDIINDKLIEKLRIQVGYLQDLAKYMDLEIRKMTFTVPPLRSFIPPKLPNFVYKSF